MWKVLKDLIAFTFTERKTFQWKKNILMQPVSVSSHLKSQRHTVISVLNVRSLSSQLSMWRFMKAASQGWNPLIVLWVQKRARVMAINNWKFILQSSYQTEALSIVLHIAKKLSKHLNKCHSNAIGVTRGFALTTDYKNHLGSHTGKKPFISNAMFVRKLSASHWSAT